MRNLYLISFIAFVPVLGQSSFPLSSSQQSELRQMARSVLDPTPGTSRNLFTSASPRLDPDLHSLISPSSERSLTNQQPVRVALTCDSLANVPRVQDALRQLGAEVTASFETTLFVQILPQSLPQLASLTGVSFVSPLRPIRSSQALPSPTATDGLQIANFEALRRAGATGKGVRIGVLDAGFSGYSSLVRRGLLSPPSATRAFPPSHAVENSDPHGTACAEIIFSAAPQASLVLASYDGSPDQFLQATSWLISQGVQIISFSMGTSNGPSNGEDVLSRFVDFTTRQSNVLWIVSAGNQAQNHWSATIRNSSKDGIIETGNRNCPGLQILPSSTSLSVLVKWDDWGPNPLVPNSTQDINLALVGYDPATPKPKFELMASSRRPQGPGLPPQEFLTLSRKDLYKFQFCLVLAAPRLDRPVRLHVFLTEGQGKLLPSNPSGSITNPATARSALAVGAIDVLTRTVPLYSSQGPTDDLRVKPDLAAPTNTISAAYSGRFPGTSASCPHVTAFAALLLSLQPSLTTTALRQQVLNSLSSLGSQTPNNAIGHGFIDGTRAVVAASNRPQSGTPRPLPSTLAVPASFGSSVNPPLLAQFRARANVARDDFQVRLVTGSELYHLGDGMRLGLLSSEDAQCIIFNFDSRSGYSLAFPSPIPLRAGRALVLPSTDAGTFEVVEPLGPAELLLVCARKPQPLHTITSQPENWATSLQPYFVRPRRGSQP